MNQNKSVISYYVYMIPFDDIIRNLLNIKLARFNSLIKRFRSAIHSGKTEDNRGPDVSYLMSFLLPPRSISRVETVPERREGSVAVAGCCGENKDVTRPYLRVVK